MSADRSMALSKHYLLGDLLVDSTFPDMAAQLDPAAPILANLKRLTEVIDRIADAFPPKWKVLSGYRDQLLNEACRKAGMPASVESLHLYGCAADIEPTGDDVDLEAVYEWITVQTRTSDLAVHEAVYYPHKGFIHIGVENPEKATAKRIIMRT